MSSLLVSKWRVFNTFPNTHLERVVQAVEAAEAPDRGGGGGGGGGGLVLVKVTVFLHQVTVGVPGDMNIL